MKRTALRIFAWLLTLTMLLPTAAFAEGTQDAPAGRSSEHIMRAEVRDRLDTLVTAERTLPEAGTYREGELLVKMRRTASLLGAEDVFADYAQDCERLFSVEEEGARLLSAEPSRCDWYRLTLREDADMLSSWRALEQDERITAVQPNYIYTAQATTADIMDADPYLHAQTWLDRINAVEAWDGGANIGSGVIVAVVDSGVDLDHPDLADNLVPGYDFADDDDVPDDDDGHGTHVAGIIAACCNDVGVRGVACGARIMPVRVLGANGSGSSATIARGIEFAAENGASVINMSLGGVGQDTMEADAIRAARERGCLVVASAGNDNLPTALADGETYGGVYVSPANDPGVLTVMAADEDGTLASFSNYDADPGAGAEYELMAPGVNILSTTMGGGYGYMNGTSMACPVVAGAAAVLMGMGCDAESAFTILASCAKTDAGRVDYRYPSLDLAACVARAKQSADASRAVNVTNVSLSAPVSGVQYHGRMAVRFWNLDTERTLYLLDDTLWSEPTLCFENIGGAGEVRVTGSVGGVAVDETRTVAPGEVVEIMLTLDAAPEIENGMVEIELQVGEEAYHALWDAYRLRFVADEPGFETDGTETTQTAPSALLRGDADAGTVWVLDAALTIPDGCELTVMRRRGDRGLIVYQAEGAEIDCAASGRLDCLSATLAGDGFFSISASDGLTLEYCTILDPQISWLDYCGCCTVIGTMEGWRGGMLGDTFELCGFYDCDSFDLGGTNFWANMISGCTYSTMMVAGNAVSNTFVENFAPDDADSVLKIRTVEIEPGKSWLAFRYNCVVGPLLLRDFDDTRFAPCERTYHQSAPSELLPEGLDDEIACMFGSVVGETVEEYRSFGCDSYCPLFALDMTGSYEYVGESRIDYGYEIECSAELCEYAAPVFSSATDMFADTAIAQREEDYPNWCAVSGSTRYEDDEVLHFYSLENVFRADVTEETDNGVQSYDYSATALSGQTLPVWYSFHSTALDSVNGARTAEGYTLTWEDEQLEAGDRAKIWASVNGGEETPLGTVEDAFTVRSFTDTAVYGADSTVCYRVEIYRGGRLYKSGEMIYLISRPDSMQGLELLVGAFRASDAAALSAATEGKVLLDGCLAFTFPGLRATAVTFGEEVRSAGIVYGALCDETGTTVYLGHEDSAVLNGGEALFTLTVAADDGEKTVSVLNGGAAQSWGRMDSVTYSTVSGVRTARCGESGVMQLWSDGDGLLASYDDEGRMLGVTRICGAFALDTPLRAGLRLYFVGGDYVPRRESLHLGAEV